MKTDRHVLSKWHEPFKRALDAIGESEKLTIMVGAGASVDAGFPSWRSLLSRLLETGFNRVANDKYYAHERQAVEARICAEWPDERYRPSVYEYLAQVVLDRNDLRAGATIARTLHEGGGGLAKAVYEAMYDTAGTAPPPGRITRSIAGLATLFYGTNVKIITTNYDDLLETAIQDSSVHGKTYRSKSRSPDGPPCRTGKFTYVVEHVHGLLPSGGEIPKAEAALVLDERSYVKRSEAAILLMAREFDQPHPKLLVGMSLSDPNVVAALYRAHSPKAIYGIFVEDPNSGTDLELVSDVQHARLDDLGVEAITLRSFGQVSQILIETRLRRFLGDQYWSEQNRYGHRFSSWRTAHDTRYRVPQLDLVSDSEDDFSQCHVEFLRWQNGLQAYLNQFLASLSIGPVDLSEHMALEVWARKPGEFLGSIELVGSSARVIKEPWLIGSVGGSNDLHEVARHTGLLAAKSVYFGAAQKQNNTAAVDRTRWQAGIAVPISLSDQPYYEIPVGSVCLLSTKRWEESVFKGIFDQNDHPIRKKKPVYAAERDLVQELTDLGVSLLDPAKPLPETIVD